MFEALKEKGVAVGYQLFEGEGHGFRKAENIRLAIESEYSFYAQIFDIPVKENIHQVEIENLGK